MWTFIGFLLLNISINTPQGFATDGSIILLVALYSISFAVSFFAMPVIYHHLQYPYRDLEKFKSSSFHEIWHSSGGVYIVFGIGLRNEV